MIFFLEPSLSPQAVMATVESSRSINVSWSPVRLEDRNGIIQGYKVIYRALPNGNNETEIVNATINDQDKGQTLTLEKLNEYTNYSIRVLAFTLIGDGPLSVADVKQTQEDSKLLVTFISLFSALISISHCLIILRVTCQRVIFSSSSLSSMYCKSL